MPLTLKKFNLAKEDQRLQLMRSPLVLFIGLSIRSISLDKVLARWEEDVVDLSKLSRTSSWRLLKSVGFSYEKTNSNRQIIMEKQEIVAKKHLFCEKSDNFQIQAANRLFG